VEELGRRIAEFHRQAERNERITSFACFTNVERLVDENLASFRHQDGSIVKVCLAGRLNMFFHSALEENRGRIAERAARGVLCDTHVDLMIDRLSIFTQSKRHRPTSSWSMGSSSTVPCEPRSLWPAWPFRSWDLWRSTEETWPGGLRMPISRHRAIGKGAGSYHTTRATGRP
jgi:hypothetical protein